MSFLQLELLLDWIRQLSNAELFVFQHGVIRRDMKLENILLSQDCTIKVCDFGSALRVSPSNMTIPFVHGTSIGGNPAHLSPETLSAAIRLGM